MKTLYVCGAFGEPYRIVISDALLEQTRKAQRVAMRLPWNCEMFIPVDAVRLGVSGDTERVQHAEICIGKDHASLVVDGPEGRETMLSPDDDFFTLPDVYLSIDFYFSLNDHIFSLCQGDIDVVEKWKILRTQNFEKFIQK